MRIVLGVVAGIVAAFACVLGIEMVGHLVFPPPPGTNLEDPAQLARLIENLPIGAFAFVVAAWFIGSLAGAWVANLVAKRALPGWIVVVLVLAGAVYTMMTIPHPAWMWAMGIGLPLVAGWLAQRLAKVPV